MQKSSYQQREVAWYRNNGKYPAERIALCGNGEPYVIGDDGWNNGTNQPEWIERQMERALKSVTPNYGGQRSYD